MKLLQRLWKEERGFYASTELLVLGTLIVGAAVVGGSALRTALVTELGDTAASIQSIHANPNDPDPQDVCIEVCGAATPEGRR